MNSKILQKQIGQRITSLRKNKGLTQESLAKSIKISRPSLAQIELGNRNLEILELQKLSMILEFSLDDFMSKDFSVKKYLDEKEDPIILKNTVRISEPTLQINKTKNILLYILERCAGKPNVGETVLYKMLYFADFNYYELYETHLTGSKYQKSSYGPVPEKMDTIINQMIESKQIQRVKTTFNNTLQMRYLPLEKANLFIMSASEKDVIDRVIAQMSDWSSIAISKHAQKDMPWLATKEGDLINYELAFYREVPFTVRNYEEENE